MSERRWARRAAQPASSSSLVLGLLGRVGHRDRDQADGARPRPPAAAPSSSTRAGRRRRRRGHPGRRSTGRSRSSASASTRSGVSEPEISRVGSDRDPGRACRTSRTPSRRSSRSGRPRSSTSTTSRRNVIPPPNSSAPKDPTTAADHEPRRLHLPEPLRGGAVRLEAKAGVLPERVHDERAHLLPVRQEVPPARSAGPAEQQEGPVPPASRTRSSRRDRRSSRCRRGRSSSRRSRRTTRRSPRARARSRRHRSSVLNDRPALTGDDITNPEQNFDPTTNQPNVTFDFTDAGPDGVPGRDPDDRPARRGDRAARHRAARARGGPVLAALRDRPRQPGRLAARSSTSSTTRTGSTAAPAPRSPATSRSARRRTSPKFLKIGALPIKLTLISQSTVSATLGQQALDQGLKAGHRRPGAGRPLPARLLPPARR